MHPIPKKDSSTAKLATIVESIKVPLGLIKMPPPISRIGGLPNSKRAGVTETKEPEGFSIIAISVDFFLKEKDFFYNLESKTYN